MNPLKYEKPFTVGGLQTDPQLLRLPSGRFVSVRGVRDFDPNLIDAHGRCEIVYFDGRRVILTSPQNIHAFAAALKSIAVQAE